MVWVLVVVLKKFNEKLVLLLENYLLSTKGPCVCGLIKPAYQ